MPALLVFGATGYVGENVVRTAAGLGLDVIAAGRNGTHLDAIGKELGIESRTFAIDDRAAVDRGLTDVAVVLNCAGPFLHTAETMVAGCLRGGAHYLDITGEIPVFQALHARHAEAKSRGIMVLPGVGFDVVPTDCLALHLKQRLPTATHLTLAFRLQGPAGLPPGTQRTAIELLQYGDLVRRDGTLQKPDGSRKTISVDFGEGPVIVQRLTWGDVFTAYLSTGIPNIEDYTFAAPALRRQMAFARAIAPLSKFAFIRNLMFKTVRPGPTAVQRALTTTSVWGEVVNSAGRRATARVHGPEAGLVWTTRTALDAARKVLSGVAPAGYQTPSSAFGADFVLEQAGVTREDVNSS